MDPLRFIARSSGKSFRRPKIAGPDMTAPPESWPVDWPVDWPLAMTLLVTLLRPDAATAAPPLVAAMGPQADWSRFLDLAIRRHRVAPLLTAPLAALDVPARVKDCIDTETKANALKTLAQIAETQALVQAFAAIGANPVVIKGWALAEHLYGSAAARHTGDIDLLIRPDEIAACNMVLGRRGYVPGRHRRAAVIGHRALWQECKDIEYNHPGSGHSLELHWRLCPFRHWPEPIALPGAIELHETAGGPVRTLSDAANMIYLSVHGCLHIWSRLKWLTDIARLAKRRGPAQLEQDLLDARAIGAGPAVALALRLAARLLASPLPPSLQAPPYPGLSRREVWILKAMTRAGTAPDAPYFLFWVRLMLLRTMNSPAQLTGLVRYDTLRRVRLALKI